MQKKTQIKRESQSKSYCIYHTLLCTLNLLPSSHRLKQLIIVYTHTHVCPNFRPLVIILLQRQSLWKCSHYFQCNEITSSYELFKLQFCSLAIPFSIYKVDYWTSYWSRVNSFKIYFTCRLYISVYHISHVVVRKNS